MPGQLLTVADTTALIDQGARLLLAADESLLATLPPGQWIAGTIPYFMASDGGTVTRDQIYVDRLPDDVHAVRIVRYRTDQLANMVTDRFDNGFSVIIVPAATDVHLRFAQDAPGLIGLFDQPLVGWVAGVHLSELHSATAKVFAGDGQPASSDECVVLHAQLAPEVLASVDIINLFHQGEGPSLTFDQTGFAQTTVNVDGEPHDFATYLHEIGHDVRLPLVADYFGAMVNVSIQEVPTAGPVTLYAPVFDGVTYRLAAPVGDYVADFSEHLHVTRTPTFSCNCILNFVYSELEGKHTGDFVGPVTFGEIAYQLLNQTLVYLTLHH